MSLAKGDSSSHRKGKEDATDDPPTKTLGEEAPYSKSNRFEEEEGGCDLGSECHPLIDPWYDTHIHFPIVPGDYLPLHRAARGFLSSAMTLKSLGLPWLPSFLTSTSTKGPHYPCPFFSNLGRVRLWV